MTLFPEHVISALPRRPRPVKQAHVQGLPPLQISPPELHHYVTDSRCQIFDMSIHFASATLPRQR